MIRKLGADVVDRIAAGEVLDRPANLIKELVENSLDAGADQIDIEFEQGGRCAVVTDNGAGMGESDLKLALERHATSKITSSDDLFKLGSFGFRGEALASVAAVARVSLTSSARGSGKAFRVLSEFGAVSAPVEVSGSEGTEIRVSELFANVPARLKFLKSEASEHGQIKTTLKALALAHERVGFSVRMKDQLLYHWPKGQSFLNRAQMVLECDGLFSGEYETSGMRAEVLVSSPDRTLNVNRNMWFFVQRRWIQDRSLNASVMEAYRNLLMHGEYPMVVARIELPPDEVDVNVHPTKSQVKFREPQLAFRVVNRAIRGVLEKSPWLNGELNMTPLPPHSEYQAEPKASQPETLSFRDREFERTQYATKSFPLSEVRTALQSFSPDPTTSVSRESFHWASLHVIGQLNQTYIVAQSQESFYLVDQHAAHERVVFEKLMAAFHAGQMEVQNLLLPMTLDLAQEEVEALLREREGIERLGLSLERMGPETVAVQAIPTLVKEGAVSVALAELAHQLQNHQGERALEKSIGEIFASMACHSVVRAGQTLSVEEMKSLLAQMDQYPLSSFCPHGRPVFVKRRFSELEREFGRIV